MANFTTHIGVGTVATGVLATLTLAADVVAPENLIAVTLAGVLGSVLPDIDLKDSRPSRALFSGLAVFLSFSVLFTFATKYSIAELWILWLGTLVIVRYGLQTVFHRLSTHRGNWHSLLGGALAACLTAVIFKHVLGRHEGVAWLAAGFMMIGYIVHLLLDEIYSVDVMDTRIKASFGTALKLVDRRYPAPAAAMLVATALAFQLTPTTNAFVDGISSRGLWTGLHQRLLPQGKWFGVIGGIRGYAEAAPESQPEPQTSSSQITTGSLSMPTQAPADVRPSPAADGEGAEPAQR